MAQAVVYLIATALSGAIIMVPAAGLAAILRRMR